MPSPAKARHSGSSDAKNAAIFLEESGRATAPPSVCYSSLLTSPSEGYTTVPSSEPSEQSIPGYSTYSFNDFIQQRAQPPGYDSDYNSCSTPQAYSSPSKPDNHQFQSAQFSEDFFTSSLVRFPSFANQNSSSFLNSSSNDVNANSSNNESNFEFASREPSKGQEDFIIEEDNLLFQPPEQLSSAAFNQSKIPKSNFLQSSKHGHNISPPSSQTRCGQDKETVDLCLEKGSRSRRNSEGGQKPPRPFKDESLEESCRNGTRIKNAQEIGQDLVTDSFLQLLQRKTGQESLSYELGELSPILISLTSKYKPEEFSGLRKKEGNEDSKLMNDFLAKLILEKEEKRFKALEEKKKFPGKETFDELSNEMNERKLKRDAMSHYQEDKNHKRSSNYGDYNQWEYFGQQDIQSSNRRGHFPFGNAAQQHSVGWNQMGIGLPRQSSPYYANPHGHVMPAHAHSDYRYNQWTNPNHKNIPSIPNVHNAHSQNTPLPQTKMDMKHHSDISSSVQDFGLPLGSTSDFSKFRAASRDLLRRSSPSVPEKSLRAGIRADLLTAIAPGMRNSSMRTPPIPSHPKTVVNNPLSDLQMLVTSQESENPPQKSDHFQQESVDLSAHSDASKQKEKPGEKDASNANSKDAKDFRTSVSGVHVESKQVISDPKESEKPVELTAKSSEKSSSEEGEGLPCRGRNLSGGESERVKEESKTSEDVAKGSASVGKSEEEKVREEDKKEADIPKDDEGEEAKESGVEEKEKVAEEKARVEERKPEGVDAAEGEKPVEVKETGPDEAAGDVESTKNCKRQAEEEEEPAVETKKALLETETQKATEEENAELPTVTSTSTDAKPTANELPKKTAKKKPSKKSRMARLSSGQSSGSERSIPCKKWKASGKKMKKSLCEVMDRRGPFLHVMGTRECPDSVTVVNFPKGDDEDEKEKSATKKQLLNASRTKHQNELDYRGRSRNGLYCSTLSARYDAHSKDYTWICVFCKKGPHYSSLGDLFGPYIISEDENNSLGEFSGDEKDISDAQKRGGRNKKSLRSNNMVEHFQKMSKKLRRTQSTESCLTGMTVISDDQVDQLRYEVWVHEQCAVWSPNVCLIGSRIIGMQEAIWCSVKTMCSKCGVTGANIGCVYRNCPNRSHYHCAKECGWSLQQETFISTCHIHKPRS